MARVSTRVGFKFRWDYYDSKKEAEAAHASARARHYISTPPYWADGMWIHHWRDWSPMG